MITIEKAKSLISKDMPERTVKRIRPFKDQGYVCLMPGKGVERDISGPFYFIEGRTGRITKINPLMDREKMEVLTR